MSNLFVSVILETNIDKPLDYLVPDHLKKMIKEGQLVEVPIRNILKKAIVLSIKDKSEIKKVLEIKRIAKDTVITKDVFKLAIWMSKYYSCSLSKVLRCIVPSSIRKEINPKSQIFLTTNKTKNDIVKILSSLLKKSPSQAKALEYFLKTKKGIFLQELILKAKISRAPIDSLIAKNIFKAKKVIVDDADILSNFTFFKTKDKKLTSEQQAALDKIEKSIIEEKFKTHLIFGVTSSGKTEIYLRAIKKALSLNKTAIMLVPEIALTSQTIERFKARFSEKIAVFHHKKSFGEKTKAFDDILSGKAKIVIGARSAIFSPLKNLGIIIIDEEHDSSYKQSEEAPTYTAKHLAIIRAKNIDATVVLASATPSMESYYNALNNKYELSVLKNRIGKNKSLPKITIVDMKVEIKKSKSYFSNALLTGIKKRYLKGEQTLLFLNRRGYHTSITCLNCSYSFKCPHCDISLTYHKANNYLVCHLCGHNTHLIKHCPECNSSDYIKFKGHGTEHVESAIKAIFPQIKTLRVDRDTTTKKNSHETLFKQFKSGKADILIGTQMIVKGLHFPSVSLVGVLNTDSALNIPDFRSFETVFSLITQVSGRAGREETDGEVIIQTYMPDNEIIKLGSKQDYVAFYDREIQNRKLFEYPPFTQMVKIVFSSKKEDDAIKNANDFRNKLIKNLSSNYTIHPVVPSGRAKIKDLFKYQFLIRGKKIMALTKEIEKIKKSFKLPSSTTLLIDVDPLSTFF